MLILQDDWEVEQWQGIIAFQKRFDAHLSAFVPLPAPDMMVPMGASGMGGVAAGQILARMANDHQHHQEKMQKMVAALRKTSVDSLIDFIMPAQRADEILIQHGPYHDLLILEKSLQSSDSNLSSLYLESAVLQTGRPVLILPKDRQKIDRIGCQKICIAWDQTPQAVHALLASMPFLRQAQEITVITVCERSHSLELAQEKRVRLESWFALQDLRNMQHHIVELGRGSVGESLQAHMPEDTDLFVMGGYHHSPVREWLLGGATRTMLETANMPLLLAH